MLKRKHYRHVFFREVLCQKINILKILKNAKTASNFYFPCLKGWFFNMSIYDLVLFNSHGQISPGQQNAKEITV